VPIGKVRDLTKGIRGRIWRGAEAGWAAAGGDLFAGATLFLETTHGGYSPERGWTGDATDQPESLYRPETRQPPSNEDLLSRLDRGWQTIGDHTGEVQDLLAGLLETDDGEVLKAFKEAALWHDYGKAHLRWQRAARLLAYAAGLRWPRALAPVGKFSYRNSPLLVGKSGWALKREIDRLDRSFRPRLRHEVASALSLRIVHRCVRKEPTAGDRLSEYLVMSHHGRVRKFLRDELPRESGRGRKPVGEVRGVCEGDSLPRIEILGGPVGPVANLSIACREIGRGRDGTESWTRGVLKLLEDFGPFKLGYFEAIFRAADRRASRDPKKNVREAEVRS
jgi:CRISPR-associated endonuclease/helicase Cas3